MRICYVLPTAGIAGGVNIIIEHSSRLAMRGHEIFFLQCDSNKDLSWYPGCIVPSYSIHSEESIRFYMSKPVDILIATGWQTVYEIFRRKLPAFSYAYFFQANEKEFYPLDSTQHDLAWFTATLPFNYYTEATWICKMLKADYGHDVFYARHGINRELFYPSEPIVPKPKNKVRILLEGPLSQPRKRMDDAFLAVDGLDAEVWLATSGGDLQPWQKPDMMFTKVPISKMKHIYSACDILVKLPTVEGVFGPPLEMMSCGGTCVTSDVLGHDEYIIDGYNAFVVPMGDFRAANSALQYLLDNPSVLEQMKAHGLQTALEFNWQPTIDQLEQYLFHILESDRQKITTLDTSTIKTYFNLSYQQEIALRLYLRRYFELTWNMGPLEVVFSTDRIIDSFQLEPFFLSDLFMLRVKGWAFNTESREPFSSIKALVEEQPLEVSKIEWCERPDLAKNIDPLAFKSGYNFISFLSFNPCEIQVLGCYFEETFITKLIEYGEIKYGVIEEIWLLNCYQINISTKVFKYPEGFCLTLHLDSYPSEIYIGCSQDNFWSPGYSVTEVGSIKNILIDDLRLLSEMIPNKRDKLLVWLPQSVCFHSITVEPSAGKTMI